ncbi:MAG: hypothetical protein K2K53_02100 [Oscillospiraceae bacterium]|nr:hypothetical protein [Oscillospiraceae bacterium]
MKNIMKRAVLLTLALALALGLTACGASKPDMPMEATFDGHTVALGKTTTAEMAGWGWNLKFTGTQSEIREDAKYVACYYTVEKNDGRSGDVFWVSVWVPFQKNFQGSRGVDFSEEEKMSRTEGVVCRIEMRKDASENFDITYNGKNYQDLTWADAEEWGAEKDEDAYPTTYNMSVAQGSLKFEKGYTSEDEPGKFTISMNTGAFSKLQK